MNAPDLMEAVHIAWVSLLKQHFISEANIEQAPLQLLSAVIRAAKDGDNDPQELAKAAVRDWLVAHECDEARIHRTLH